MRTYCLIQVELESSRPRLVRQISLLPGVRSVECVRGGYDVIAGIEGGPAATLPHITLHEITRLRGVLRALPLHVADGGAVAPSPRWLWDHLRVGGERPNARRDLGRVALELDWDTTSTRRGARR